MTKSFRHGQILNLIRTRSIFTQDELARALKESAIDATQVTLSRDMRELGLVKTNEGYRDLGRETPSVQFATLAGEFLQDVRLAQNQVVLKTAPGHASSVAVALDDEEWPEVVGTIAGDDTILVICNDAETADAVRAKLLGLLQP
ncbi:MAG: ArgR family transcriptional regulator [Acidobacteriota bacterium]|nr:ArgR family transcriptional regulator [Acidobacteriota bacterium]